jgi:hypothetical protein
VSVRITACYGPSPVTSGRCSDSSATHIVRFTARAASSRFAARVGPLRDPSRSSVRTAFGRIAATSSRFAIRIVLKAFVLADRFKS